VNGQGAPLNYTKARELFELAAEQNNASAQYQLGLMYFKGKGLRIDLTEAYKWLTLAGDYDDAALYRDYVAKKMSKDQIEEAQALADDWKPKDGAKK
jgi:TPR repeat protein